MRHFLVASLLAAATLLSAGAPAQTAAPAQRLGQIKPTYKYTQSTIAVARFAAVNVDLEIETLPRIIRNDLELSGFFKAPADQLQVNHQNLKEGRNGDAVEFAAWQAMGVEHYLRGRVTGDGPNYKVDIQLFDIASQRVVMSQTFTDRREAHRNLGHRISDAIIEYLKGVEGIFRTKILFVSEQIPGTKEIAIMDADGFEARPLTRLGKLATTPTWGKNGTEYYFMSYHGNRANVYGMQLLPDASMHFSPGTMWTIAAYGGTNGTPSWSPAAGRIAMVLSKDGNSELYTSLRDGTGLQRLTTTKFTEGSPTWSPDGARIAYTSNEAGGVHLFVMDAGGANKRRVTTLGSWNDAVSWSPDGKRLAFVARQGGVNDIYLCDVSGSTTSYKRLTMGQGNNESPSWAPNGTHLTFSSNRSGRWQVYLMLDDGSNQRALTSSGRNTLPDWGPQPPQ